MNKVFKSFSVGALFGGLLVSGVWLLFSNNLVLIYPVKEGVSFGGKLGSDKIYTFELDGIRVYFSKRQWMAICPSGGEFPFVKLHKEDATNYEVTVLDNEKKYFILSAKNGAVSSYQLQIGAPSNRLSYLDIGANGIYDMRSEERESKKKTTLFVDGKWYDYQDLNGSTAVVTDHGVREVLKNRSGFIFK